MVLVEHLSRLLHPPVWISEDFFFKDEVLVVEDDVDGVGVAIYPAHLDHKRFVFQTTLFLF